MRNLRVALISALFAGCGLNLPALGASDGGGASDGSVGDSGVSDGGAMDGSEPGDSGEPDSGMSDGGAPDSGMSDGGPPDSGMSDGGPPDSGMSDGGPPRDGGFMRDGGVIACTANTDCDQGDYCAGRGCGTAGVCTAEPAMCGTTTPVQVCGCDGMTYGSKCLANQAGVREESTGACGTDGGCTGPMCTPDAGPPPPPLDGGCASVLCPPPDAGSISCMSDSNCPTTQYCAGNGCGTVGTCATKPTTCGTACQFPEVCGCNGDSYCNSCLAEAAGTRVDSTGASCGGVPDAGFSCSSNIDCELVLTPGGSSGGAGGSTSQLYCEANGCGVEGQCEPEPTDCTPSMTLVCGCDGNTYAGSCEAAFSGVNVDSTGASCSNATDGGSASCTTDTDCLGGQICCQYTDVCVDARDPTACVPPPPGSDGGVSNGSCAANTDCASGSYCDMLMACTGMGACTAEPTLCSAIVAPVCGCDGNTYSNACEAAAAGVSVLSQTACGNTLPPGGP